MSITMMWRDRGCVSLFCDREEGIGGEVCCSHVMMVNMNEPPQRMSGGGSPSGKLVNECVRLFAHMVMKYTR